VIKYLIALLSVFLVACETSPLTGSSGQPIPPEVDIQCKKQCVKYDSRMGVLGTANCTRECVKAKGY